MQIKRKQTLSIKQKSQQFILKHLYLLQKDLDGIFQTLQFKKWFRNLILQYQQKYQVSLQNVKIIIHHIAKNYNSNNQTTQKTQLISFNQQLEKSLPSSSLSLQVQPEIVISRPQLQVEHLNEIKQLKNSNQNQRDTLVQQNLRNSDILQPTTQLALQPELQLNTVLNLFPQRRNLALDKKIIEMNNEINNLKGKLKNKKKQLSKNLTKITSFFMKKPQIKQEKSQIKQEVTSTSSMTMLGLNKSIQKKHVEMKIGEVMFYFQATNSEIKIVDYKQLALKTEGVQDKRCIRCLRCPKVLTDPLSRFVGLGLQCRNKQYQKLLTKQKLI